VCIFNFGGLLLLEVDVDADDDEESDDVTEAPLEGGDFGGVLRLWVPRFAADECALLRCAVLSAIIVAVRTAISGVRLAWLL
jgi:hypothetical protein